MSYKAFKKQMKENVKAMGGDARSITDKRLAFTWKLIRKNLKA